MKTIYKYTLPIKEVSVILMPSMSNIIECSEQDGFIRLWAIVETENENIERQFHMFKTGQEIKDSSLSYIGCAKIVVGQELCLYIF